LQKKDRVLEVIKRENGGILSNLPKPKLPHPPIR